MSFSATSHLKSRRRYRCRGSLTSRVPLYTRKALIRHSSKIKFIKNFQYFLDGLPTGFLARCCMARSTPPMLAWYWVTGGGLVISTAPPRGMRLTTGSSPRGEQAVLNTWTFEKRIIRQTIWHRKYHITRYAIYSVVMHTFSFCQITKWTRGKR